MTTQNNKPNMTTSTTRLVHLTCLSPSLPLSRPPPLSLFFFFNAPAPTEIYTLSLHDALPISTAARNRDHPVLPGRGRRAGGDRRLAARRPRPETGRTRSEEHTSELQSQFHLVCRLLLEKKKKKQK